MTLKQNRLLKNLKDSPTVMDAAIKAGYSAGARNMYRRNTKKRIAEAIHSNPEAIKARFEHLSVVAEKKKDLTNAIRGTEALARIQGMFLDRSEVKSTGDINVNERLTRLVSILQTNRLAPMLAGKVPNNARMNATSLLNQPPTATNAPQPISDHSPEGVRALNTTGKPKEAIQQDSPAIKQGTSAEEGGRGGRSKRAKMDLGPPETVPILKPSSESASGSAVESAVDNGEMSTK